MHKNTIEFCSCFYQLTFVIILFVPALCANRCILYVWNKHTPERILNFETANISFQIVLAFKRQKTNEAKNEKRSPFVGCADIRGFSQTKRKANIYKKSVRIFFALAVPNSFPLSVLFSCWKEGNTCVCCYRSRNWFLLREL